MKNTLNNKFLTAATILVLTTAALITSAPVVNAADVETYAYMSVVPDPVGVDQRVNIQVWIQPSPPASGLVFHDFTVTVTKPDGTTEKLGPADSFKMGGYYFSYTPKETGEYTFKFNYPGDTFYTGDHFLPAESPTKTLTVQQEPLPEWPSTPLPDDYWTRPINAENRGWWKIGGNWLMRYYNSTYNGFGDAGGGYNPYSEAPRAPHIMWTKELALGGLAGGKKGSLSHYSGMSYGTYLSPPIILNGKLYYNTEPSTWSYFQASYSGFKCVDLRTGKELWQREDIAQGDNLDSGQLYMTYAPAGPGVRPFLWDKTGDEWHVYDPFDGETLMTFENATSGTDWWWEDPVVFGEDGTMYVYILKGYSSTLAMWNSTKCFQENGIIGRGSEGLLRFGPKPGTYDWKKGIEWEKSIPPRVGNTSWYVPYSIFGINQGVAIAKSGSGGNIVSYDIAYNTTTGEEIWVHDKTEAVQTFFSTTGQGIFASFDLADRRWTGYDIKTGNKLWESDPNQRPWGTYVSYGAVIANGKLYSGSFDGHMHAFNITTGEEEWNFYAGDSGRETPFESWPMWEGPLVADGVVFCGTGEETPTQPLTRGNKLFAVDAETGEGIWNISGWMYLGAIADGYLVGYNAYDNQAYTFGKGPSKTTVTAPKTAIPKGESVLIEGTVTDQSAGAKTSAVQSKAFGEGVACVADEDMSGWMEYLYMQQECPAEVKGVPVFLQAIGPDGDVIDIGTVTSDGFYGTYSMEWTPPKEGKYRITATFKGSESYGSSSAATALLVGQEPPETVSPTEQPQWYEEPASPTEQPTWYQEPPATVSPTEQPEWYQEPPAYTTTDLAIIAAVIVVAILVVYNIIAVRKQQK